MTNENSKLRVVFEQWVIPNYRVPFFTELSKYCDLVVVISKNKSIDGLISAHQDATFKVVQLDEDQNGPLYHPDIFSVLKDHNANIYVSWGQPLPQIFSNPDYRKKLKSLKIKTVWMGCDGFKIQNYPLALLKMVCGPKRLMRYLRERIAMSYVDRYVVYSSHTKNFLSFVKLIPRWKIFVAHNAIDVTNINKKYHELLLKNIKRIPNSIIYTGRLTAGKRVDKLIIAFSEVIKKIPEATLKIIGDGSEHQNLKLLSEKYNLGEKIKFLGGIYEDDILCKHQSEASLSVMSGLGGLGFNTAMACGLPIIYTHADGTEEDLFTDGINGWFFDGSTVDLSKKIIIALSDKNKLVTAGEISEKKITTEITIAGMVKTYIKVFNDLI